MKQLGQDEAMDSRENQIMSTLMLLLADSLENKYNLLNKFAIMNVFFLQNHWCPAAEYYNNRQNNKDF